MANRKYLKFGLRADKNLSDLDDKTEALNNILDDLSAALDENGDPLNFTANDLFPLIGLAQKGLATNVNTEGQPLELTDLAGSTAQATAVTNTLLDVEPRLTIEDHIQRFKVILGDPPWIDGGDGLEATIFDSERINSGFSPGDGVPAFSYKDQINDIVNVEPSSVYQSLIDVTVGSRYRITDLGTISPTSSGGWNALAGTNGVTYAVGSVFTCTQRAIDAWGQGPTGGAQVKNITVPAGNINTTASNNQNLIANEVFNSANIPQAQDLIGPVDFWEDGRFNFSDKIHPDLPDSFGGIQWVGYQSGRFSQSWEFNCFFTIEEDLITEPGGVETDDHWTLVKGVTSPDIETFDKVYIETVDGASRVQFLDPDDWKRVCLDMKIEWTGTGTESIVTSVFKEYSSADQDYRYYADLDSDLAVTDTTTGTYQTFYWDPFTDLPETGSFTITPPKQGERRRVRYTAWWPKPYFTSGGTPGYGQKRFYENTESGKRLSFDNFYKTDGALDVNGEFTFPYFSKNRAHVLKQDSTKKLTVDGRVSLPYKPPQFVENAIAQYIPVRKGGTGAKASPVSIKIADTQGSGKLVSSDNRNTPVFQGVEEGDWILTVYDYQYGADGEGDIGWDRAENNLHVFQILEKVDDYEVYVNRQYGGAIGIPAGVSHNVITASNKGLIGVFKKQYNNSSSTALSQLVRIPTKAVAMSDLNGNQLSNTMYVDPSKISIGDFAISCIFTGAAPGPGTLINICQDHPMRITNKVSAGANSQRITVEAHPQAPHSPGTSNDNYSDTMHLDDGIVLVYSSKGLSDKSGLHECAAVIGMEVSHNSPIMASNQKIYVKEYPGGSSGVTGNVVYFYGSTPGVPVIPEDGTVSGATLIVGTGSDATGDFITISRSLTAEIPAGTTIVGIPFSGSGVDPYLNREYCIIPLNTAPPFGSTEVGLITTNAYKNLIAREIAFDNLSINVPTADVVSLESASNTETDPNRYVSINYVNDQGTVEEYRALVNDNITT